MGLTLNVKGNVKIEQYIETQHVGTQYVGRQYAEQQHIQNRGAALPAPNRYADLFRWIQDERTAGHDYLADAGGNRTLMCKHLSDILGWAVDPNTLGKRYKSNLK